MSPKLKQLLLLVLLLILTFVFISLYKGIKVKDTTSEIGEALEEYNYCLVGSDCIVIFNGCINNYYLVNSKEESIASKVLYEKAIELYGSEESCHRIKANYSFEPICDEVTDRCKVIEFGEN